MENCGSTEPPIGMASGQVGPRLSGYDELAQGQIKVIQLINDEVRRRLQAEGRKQKSDHQIGHSPHQVAKEEQSHSQQAHDDRHCGEEEGGQGKQEHQDSHKDSQEHHKGRSNQLQ